MRHGPFVPLSLVVALGFVPPAAAADAPVWPPAAGARVRLAAQSLTGAPVVGEVVSVQAGELTLRVPPLIQPVQVPVDSITRLEVSRGHRSQIGKGALIGASGVGVFFTALFALLCHESECWSGETFKFLGKTAVAGGLAGSAVGAAFTREEWVPVVPGRKPETGLSEWRQSRPLFAVSIRF